MYWKETGNVSYQKGDYKTALECYTKAIAQNETESIFYSNRAKCYKVLGELDKAMTDAQTAI